MLEVEDIWLERIEKEKPEKKNILVFSKWNFRRAAKKLIWFKDNIAFISIENLEECCRYYREVKGINDWDNDHYLPDGLGVLNIEFDDVAEDDEKEGYHFKTISQEDADKIVEFIEKNLGKHFIIHCKAGKSRSQGVADFMFQMYPDYFEKCIENSYNPCITPNIEVVRKLKRAFFKYHGFEIKD